MFNKSRMLPFYAPDADDSGDFGDADTKLEPKSKTLEPKLEPTTDFEKAYKGLQKKYDVLFGKFQKLEETHSELSTNFADLQVQMDQKDTTNRKTTDSVSTMQRQIDSLKIELDEKNNKLNRTSIVMKEYPDLSDMVDNLPKAETDEDFRNALKNLKTSIDNKVEIGIQNRLKGVGVNDSVGFGSGDDLSVETVDTLYDKLANYPANRSQKEQLEYNRLNAAYMAKIRENQNK